VPQWVGLEKMVCEGDTNQQGVRGWEIGFEGGGGDSEGEEGREVYLEYV